MNKVINERFSGEINKTAKIKLRHPYLMENSTEETINRMKSFAERADKLKEKLNADRKTNSR